MSVLVARYRAGGYPAVAPRSRRPRTTPTRTPEVVEDEIVELRKTLVEDGFDAGAETIRWHLARRRTDVPSVATIWRVLARRGFITPAPKKRPHSSFIRFEAALPNECWQADTTHWSLADGSDSEILGSNTGTKVRLYIADLNIRVVTFDGELLRQLTLDPTRTYQPRGDT